jgi:hypothetical protein
MDKLVEETVADGRWFPLRFTADQFHFAFIPAERHRETPFLVYLQPPPNEMRTIKRSALSEIQASRTDLHFILHLGFGGSTLLGKLLAQPGVAITLQEPPVLTDIVGPGLRSDARQRTQLLNETTRLLSRPITEGEALICKMTHVGNALAAPMAEFQSTSQVLCLQTPIEEMLLSLALREPAWAVAPARPAARMANRGLGVRVAYLPRHSGSRFSKKALMPSSASAASIFSTIAREAQA